jgi:hypothetical protein
VYIDLECDIDNVQKSALVLLDLSASFDTVYHDILLTILDHQFKQTTQH